MVSRRGGPAHTGREGHGLPGGFTLIEALVALALLALGLLGAAAALDLAARLIDEAEARAGAVGLAASILDSLLITELPGPGEREEGRYQTRWRIAGDGPARVLTLEIEYSTRSGEHELGFEALHLPPLPRIPGRPPAIPEPGGRAREAWW